MNSVECLRGALRLLCAADTPEPYLQQEKLWAAMRLNNDFPVFAHAHQESRELGNGDIPWSTWLVLGGRGAGKTRLGAEWGGALAYGVAPYADHAYGRIALIGGIGDDTRGGMGGGKGGILPRSPHRADRRDRARHARGDGGGQVRHPRRFAARAAPDLDSEPAPPRMAERCDRPDLLGRRSRQPARTRVRRSMVR